MAKPINKEVPIKLNTIGDLIKRDILTALHVTSRWKRKNYTIAQISEMVGNRHDRLRRFIDELIQDKYMRIGRKPVIRNGERYPARFCITKKGILAIGRYTRLTRFHELRQLHYRAQLIMNSIGDYRYGHKTEMLRKQAAVFRKESPEFHAENIAYLEELARMIEERENVPEPPLIGRRKLEYE